MIIGTSYFTSLYDAQRYYSDYTSNSVDAVARKLMNGEIHLGKPNLRTGEKLLVIDNGCRYAIETA